MEKLKELEKYTLNMKSNRQQIEELLPEKEEIKDECTASESIVKLTDSSINGSIRSYVVKQRTVGDIRWYICSYCAKEFKKPSDLIRHIRIHTQEKPYKVSIRSHLLSFFFIFFRRKLRGSVAAFTSVIMVLNLIMLTFLFFSSLLTTIHD